MEAIKRTKIVDLLKSEAFGSTVNVKGWVRTRRGSKQVNFIGGEGIMITQPLSEKSLEL